VCVLLPRHNVRAHTTGGYERVFSFQTPVTTVLLFGSVRLNSLIERAPTTCIVVGRRILLETDFLSDKFPQPVNFAATDSYGYGFPQAMGFPASDFPQLRISPATYFPATYFPSHGFPSYGFPSHWFFA